MSNGQVVVPPPNRNTMFSNPDALLAEQQTYANLPSANVEWDNQEHLGRLENDELSDFLLPLLAPQEDAPSRKRQRKDMLSISDVSFDDMNFDDMFAEPDVELQKPVIKKEAKTPFNNTFFQENNHVQEQHYSGYNMNQPHLFPVYSQGGTYMNHPGKDFLQEVPVPFAPHLAQPREIYAMGEQPPQVKTEQPQMKRAKLDPKKEEEVANKHQVYYRRAWSSEEDAILIDYVKRNGPSQWSVIANQIKTKNANQCSQRWNKALDPRIKKGHWTADEDAQLRELVKKIGHKWKNISRYIEGRTGKQCRDRFTARLSKHIKDEVA